MSLVPLPVALWYLSSVCATSVLLLLSRLRGWPKGYQPEGGMHVIPTAVLWGPPTQSSSLAWNLGEIHWWHRALYHRCHVDHPRLGWLGQWTTLMPWPSYATLPTFLGASTLAISTQFVGLCLPLLSLLPLLPAPTSCGPHPPSQLPLVLLLLVRPFPTQLLSMSHPTLLTLLLPLLPSFTFQPIVRCTAWPHFSFFAPPTSRSL